MEPLKNKPIRAAKSLGPAFIIFGLIPRSFTTLLQIMAKGLYLDNSIPRSRKSINKNTINNTLEVIAKAVRNRTVRVAFPLATFSFILLSEMGHIAVVFRSL